jgi:hypothetical protein
MNFDELKQQVQEDLKIDSTELAIESVNTPQIHNKYLLFLKKHKEALAEDERTLRVMKKYKWLYYTGKLSREELDQFKWEPFDLNILKTDVDKFIDADDDVIKLERQITEKKELVSYLDGVVKIVANRQWNIRSAIEWIKFSHGQ